MLTNYFPVKYYCENKQRLDSPWDDIVVVLEKRKRGKKGS